MIETVKMHMQVLVELLEHLNVNVISVTVETEDGVFILLREANDASEGE